MAYQVPQHEFCFLVMGSRGAGKTAFINSATLGVWDDVYEPSLPVPIPSEYMRAKIQIYNTGIPISYSFVEIPCYGQTQELPENFIEQYLEKLVSSENNKNKTFAIFIIIDRYDLESHHYAQNIIDQLISKYPIVICETKCDIEYEPESECSRWIKKFENITPNFKVSFCSVSAKSKINLYDPCNIIMMEKALELAQLNTYIDF